MYGRMTQTKNPAKWDVFHFDFLTSLQKTPPDNWTMGTVTQLSIDEYQENVMACQQKIKDQQ